MLHKALSIYFISVGICITTCQAIALGETCTASDPCTKDNSECRDDKCQCKTGYTEEEGGCKISLEKACTQYSDCVSNSKCTTDSKKCTCAEGYFAKDGLCSKAVSDTSCTPAENECDSIANSHCDTDKCKCNDGFVMNADVCTVDTSGKVTDTGCTKDAENQCTHTRNAECDNADTDAKCKCSDGYAENRMNGKTCVQTVSGTTCTAAGTECDGIDNSHCVAAKCKCNDGFLMKADVCSVDTSGKVTDTGCTKDANDQCTHTTNAECDNAETGAKCKCSEGYAEDRTNGKTCMQTVSGTACTAAGTECDRIDNSHCDADKCKCNDGFAMNVEVCTAENGATSVQFGILTIYLSILAMAQRLF